MSEIPVYSTAPRRRESAGDTSPIPSTSTTTNANRATTEGLSKMRNNKFGIYNLAHQSLAVALYATRWKQATKSAQTFCKETSAHGLKNILLKPKKSHKIVWTVFFFLAINACATQFGLRMKSYNQFRHQELVHTELADDLLFPDITLCNVIPVRRSRIGEAFNLIFKYFEQPFFLDETCESTYYQVNYPLEIGDPQAFMRHLNEEELRNISFSLEDMLIECTLGGIKCDVNDFTHYSHPTYYSCYTLNSSRVIERIKNQKPSGMLSSHDAQLLLTLFLHGADGEPILNEFSTPEIPWVKGLDYAVNMKMLSVHGMRVQVHNHGVRPTPEQTGFDFPTGFSSKIRLEPNMVKREKHPYKSNCTDQQVIEETGSLYSQSGCVDVCVQKRVTEKCGCQHVTLPELEDWPRCGTYVCNLTELFCYESIRGSEVYSDCVMQCPKSCQEVMYKTFTTSSHWPAGRSEKSFYRDVAVHNRYVEQVLGKATDDNLLRIVDKNLIRKNFLQLSVFLKDNYVTHTDEQPQYTPAGLATEFGGTLGLWVGISVVTITEFLEFLVDISGKLLAAARARCKSC